MIAGSAAGGLERLDAAPTGAPLGAPLLFVHGAFSGAWVWAEHFLPWFAARGRAGTAFSFRGHGGSAGPVRTATIEDYVADLERVVADLPAPPVIVAHSMGGFVAMRWLETQGAGRLAGLALLSSVPPQGLAGPSLSLAVFDPILLAEVGAMQAGGIDAGSIRTLSEALFADDLPAATLARYAALADGESLLATVQMQSTIRVDPARIPADLPILVMGAARDRLVPKAFVKSTARSFATRAEILPDIGHAMMLDAGWARAAEALNDWLTREGM